MADETAAGNVDESIVLVVSVDSSPDGAWRISVYDEHTTRISDLAPVLLVVRMRHEARAGTIRGSIEHPASGQRAPFQSNLTLQALVDAWLGGFTVVD